MCGDGHKYSRSGTSTIQNVNQRGMNMKKLLKEFKEFALKGNMIDLAVGMVIGAAFTAIVTSIVNDIIMPAISLLTLGFVDFSTIGIQVNEVFINIGGLLSAIVNFLIVAIVLFIVVKGINAMRKAQEKLRAKPEEEKEPEAPTTKICPYCKSEIAIDAVKCPHCTSDLKD